MRRGTVATTFLTLVFGSIAACSAPSDVDLPNDAADATTNEVATDASFPTDAGAPTITLCAKYGGYPAVEVVVDHAVAAVAADCRINAFFLTLSADKLTHVVECLKLQVGAAMGCDGLKYAGSSDTSGVACRSMTDAHKGLGVTAADFSAFVETVEISLRHDGVTIPDLVPIDSFLNATQSLIVEQPETGTDDKSTCDAGAPEISGETAVVDAAADGG